jgi:CheY-like chemotaxis protein
VSIEHSQPAEASTGASERELREGEAVRVLIVEDNPHIIEMYSYVLKKLAANELKGKLPLEVHFAAEGHAALAMLLGSTFHLVMTDLYMPVMDGFALIERIRADPTLASIPVVAISAGGTDARERAMKLGVDIFLKKPVRFAEVMDTVKQLLKIK